MSTLLTGLLVGLGAALGASLRYLAAHHLDTPGRTHPGTFLVNVAGSFLLGLAALHLPSREAAAFVALGFCGALTTYSSVTVQAANLGARRGLGYAVGTVVACLAAAWAGWSLG